MRSAFQMSMHIVGRASAARAALLCPSSLAVSVSKPRRFQWRSWQAGYTVHFRLQSCWIRYS
jgi:hypothetical protein